MKVLSVAYPLLPVSPDSAGGAEQILSLLERGLVDAGHESIVIAAQGSQISGRLIQTSTVDHEITDEDRQAAQAEHLRSIQSVLSKSSVDLIHFHGLDFHAYLPSSAVPKLATLHLPPDWYPASIFQRADLQLNCVSHAQAATTPRPVKPPVVVNGIDIGKYKSAAGARTHLLWIGRICPEKGVHIALEVARSAGLPLIVAGPVHPFRDHQRYFSECVQPLLDEQRQYVGPVDLEHKRTLLAQALALLIPSLVAETSSLVAMEAISSGTPVIGFRSGALPEVISHGVSGFIVDGQQEMVAAVQRISEISAKTCREIARQRFDSERMVQDYIKLYESLVT